MNNALKLSLSIKPCNFNRAGKVIEKHAYDEKTQQGYLVRRYTPRAQVVMLEQALPKSLKEHLLIVSYSEIHLLRPHIHTTDKCVINFYQKTSEEITTFWDGPVEPEESNVFDSGYKLLQYNKLQPVESFVAQIGDVWLLDTQKPHSVSKPYDDRPTYEHFLMDEGEQPRYVVQAFFTAPFECVADILKQEKLAA
jgi:hypothetical protein